MPGVVDAANGSYLIALGQRKDAVPWLRKAMGAPRYAARHYPDVNLARIYGKLERLDAVIARLRVALAIAPQYPPPRTEVHRLLGLLNERVPRPKNREPRGTLRPAAVYRRRPPRR